MIIEIPLTSKTSNFSQKTQFDGIDFEMVFRWNDRDSAWYMDLFDTSGSLLAAGRKMVADHRLFASENAENFPPGMIVAIDMTGITGDPGLFDLGDRVRLMYVTEDSVE